MRYISCENLNQVDRFMEPTDVPRDNNVRIYDAGRFISIIRGGDLNFVYGYGLSNAMRAANEYQNKNDAHNRGEVYTFEPIRIPDFWTKEKWLYRNGFMPVENLPDLDKPLITKIRGEVNFYNPNKTKQHDGTYVDTPNLARGILLKDCLFESVFKVKNIKSDSFIHLERCRISNEHLKLHGPDGPITIPDLKFYDSKFTEIFIDDIKSINGEQLTALEFNNTNSTTLKISNSKIDKLIISGSSKFEHIDIINSDVSSLLFNSTEPLSLKLTDCSKIGQLVVNSEIRNVVIEPNQSDKLIKDKLSNIELLDIRFVNQSFKGYLTVKDVNIGSTVLSGEHNITTLFKNLNCINLKFLSFTNSGNLRFNSIYITQYIIIDETSLGKSDFTKVVFNKNIVADVISSNVTEVHLNETYFPKNINSVNNYEGAREIYRQLKYASSKQGDRIQELEYEALELDAFKKDKNFKKSWGDNFILWSNKYSSNHGRDWRYAFGALIAITILLYNSLKLSMGYELVRELPSTSEISEYLNFALNPLHDFDKVFKDSIIEDEDLDLARVIDSIARILSGYFIFQFLRAFRKYVK